MTPDEFRLVDNYRKVNPVRQDTLLYFADELFKLEVKEREQAASAPNVVQIHRK